jgi:tRNA nucleotidyltransferase (CCA-adding enzyme)
MSEGLDEVVATIRKRVSPDTTERAKLRQTAETIIQQTRDSVGELPVTADVLQVGSTARGTWIAGDRDIDIFVAFPPSLDREQLADYGLEVGHAVLPAGHEEYAEHPYVVGERNGYAIDLVPCYAVDDATQIQSAVDRTPFHTQYLSSRLDDDLPAEIRVTKQFLKSIGVYGSDLRNRGFSGYLTELLIVQFGGFRQFIEAVTDWEPPVRFDPEGHGTTTFDDPLVVVDPTDPERNVAAVCSETNVARLQHYARELQSEPQVSLFEPSGPDAYDQSEIERAVRQRGTTPVAVRFEAPDIVPDQLWPQLRKSLDGIEQELDRRGFETVRSVALAQQDDAALLLELAVSRLPAIERHKGPPVHVREHATGFYDTYADDPDVTGPYIAGDRYVVERKREYETAPEVLNSNAIFDVSLGPHIESALESGYELLVGTGIADLATPFGTEIADYFEPKP